MTGNELQDKIFEHRLVEYGLVALEDLPSVCQCTWLLYIDSEKDYLDYTVEDAMNDIILYFSYQYRRNRRQKEYK